MKYYNTGEINDITSSRKIQAKVTTTLMPSKDYLFVTGIKGSTLISVKLHMTLINSNNVTFSQPVTPKSIL
jgi:hypothetical protein